MAANKGNKGDKSKKNGHNSPKKKHGSDKKYGKPGLKDKNYMGQGLLGKTPGALSPLKPKQIRKRASKTVRAAYKPALHEFRTQQKTAISIDKKRALDNQRYMEWLAAQEQQIRAHAQAAEQEISEQQRQMQEFAAQSIAQMRTDLMAQAGDQTGSVSNPGDNLSFDLTGEAARGQSMIANERLMSNNARINALESANTEANSNFAFSQAAEIRRQSDLQNTMKEIRSGRTKVRLEQAAAEAAEVARLLDQEISKAETRLNMRNLAAQLAMGLKAHRLEKKKFRFDKRLGLKEANEVERANRADEAQAAAELAEESRHNKATEQLAQDELILNQKQQNNENKKERRERARAITRVINNGYELLSRDRKLGSLSPNEQREQLIKRDVEPLFASAAVALYNKGHISGQLAKKLKGIGYDIPGRYLP